MSNWLPVRADQNLGLATPEEVRDPALEFVNGVVASDAITLRMAAERVDAVFSTELKVPKVVKESEGELFEDLAVVTVEGLVVTALIDTGKMKWEDGDSVQKDRFWGYDGKFHQSAKFLAGGVVANMDGVMVSRQRMVTPQGKPVYAWFAEVQVPEEEGRLTRYGLIESAQQVSGSFDQLTADGRGLEFDEISVPAAQAEYKSRLIEILEANEELDDATQEIQFALDYTGARAQAKTTLVMRGASLAPVKTHYVFGERGPVVYWFTGTEQDRTPFAVTVTKPEAWLGPDQTANFDF